MGVESSKQKKPLSLPLENKGDAHYFFAYGTERPNDQ